MVHHHLRPQQLIEAVSVEYITDSSEVRCCLNLQKAFVHRAGLSQYQSDTLVDLIDIGAERRNVKLLHSSHGLMESVNSQLDIYCDR